MSRELPVIDRPLDNTALSAYMDCPRRYKYSMVLHRAKGGRPRPALVFGTAWHAGLEAWYKGGSEGDAIASIAANWEEHGQHDDHRTLGRCIAAFQDFIKGPGDDRENTLGYPAAPVVENSVNVQIPGTQYFWAGKIDRPIVLQGHLYIEDHKTTSQLGSYYFANYRLSNQMMGYTFLGQRITGEPVNGVRINAYGVMKKEDKFAREVISYSSARIDDWVTEIIRWCERVEYSYRNDEWPANYNACYGGKYGPCQFVEVCAYPLSRHKVVLEQDYTEKVWNPLAAVGAEDDYVSG